MRRLTVYAEHGEIIGRSRVQGTSSSGNERLIVLSMFRPGDPERDQEKLQTFPVRERDKENSESALNRADFGLAGHMGCPGCWHTG